MTKKERYQYKKQNGICVNCDNPAVAGKTRCAVCAKIDSIKNKMRYAELTQEEKAKKSEYLKKWWNEHPDKVTVYRSRKSEYNRRYREGYEW